MSNKDEVSLGMGWHLKKEVTVGQIVTLMTILISGLWWAATVETRLALMANEQTAMTERIDRDEKRIDAQFGEIKSYLVRIDNKVDKIK